MIKVLLVGSNSDLYDKLTLVKQDNVDLIGLVTDDSFILKEAAQKQPSVILFSTLWESDGKHLVGMLKATLDGVKVIYVVNKYNEELIIEGMENNVDGYLLDHHEPEKIITEIVNVSKGQFVLSGDIAKTLISEIHTRYLYKKQLLKTKLMEKDLDIKDRYVDILFLILRGYKNNEIAVRLDLSEKTIRDYVSNIYNLVGIHNRIKLTAFLEELMRDQSEMPSL